MMILFVRCVSDSEKSVYECSAVPSLGIGMGFERHPSNKMMLMLTASCHRISARYVYMMYEHFNCSILLILSDPETRNPRD